LLSADALGHLAAMPTLWHLRANLIESVSFCHVLMTLKHPAFAGLTHLALSSSKASLFGSLFGLMIACPLKEVTLKTTTLSSKSTWSECYKILKSQISHESLAAITIEEDEIKTSEIADSYPTDGGMLKPLLAFHGLMEVALQHVCFALNVVDIREMALAWPHLKSANRNITWLCRSL
jgi:hypothetical protein